MWSIGCILAEMVLRRALFPGENTKDMLSLIIGFLGSPAPEVVERIQETKAKQFIQSLPPQHARSFDSEFPGAPPLVIDMLWRTLQFDPKLRYTATEALRHPYLAELHCPEDEPTRQPIDESAFEFDYSDQASIQELREELFFEALHYYPDKLPMHLQAPHRQVESHLGVLAKLDSDFQQLAVRAACISN
jgi:mitogen-activated protein kinase 1/3